MSQQIKASTPPWADLEVEVEREHGDVRDERRSGNDEEVARP